MIQPADLGRPHVSDHIPDQRLWGGHGERQLLRDNDGGQLTTRRVDQLHPHPVCVRYGLAVPASQLSALADLGDLAFREPLVITPAGTILDGRARWELARLQGRVSLSCLQYQLTEAESLHWLIQRHRRSNGLNDFIRILLALELEPWFREKALAHQRSGGHAKGSSILTEAERLDVRKEIARIAVVSAGNVTKVKQLIPTANPDVINALRNTEISIHRAWSWRRMSPSEQTQKLLERQSTKHLRRTIRQMVSQHRSRKSSIPVDVNDLIDLVSAIRSGKFGAVEVVPVKGAANIVFVGEGLLRAHKTQKELTFACDTNTL